MAVFVITGIAGFIGSSIARELVRRGDTVRGLDNLSTGRLENIEEIQSSIDFEVGDIRDTSRLKSLFAGADFVLHQAALASVPRSVKDPVTSHDSNINGTLSVLVAARDARVRRVVYAASSSAYGNQDSKAKEETMIPRPMSPYAVQKLSCEYYIQSFAKVYGLEGICLRYFNIFGPRQAADSPYSGVIAQFIHKMMSRQTPTINGDGLTSRDFTYVRNAVQANLLACYAPKEFATGRVYNVGTGESQTLNQLYAKLGRLLDFHASPIYTTERDGDVRHSLANIERARKELGYQAQYGFTDGLQATVQWYVAQQSMTGNMLSPLAAV